MTRPQGFRCRRCRAELLARPPEWVRDAKDWTPPVLCCGLLLLRIPPEQVLSAWVPRGRHVCCPVCGISVQLVVKPHWPLRCATCRRALEVPAGEVQRVA